MSPITPRINARLMPPGLTRARLQEAETAAPTAPSRTGCPWHDVKEMLQSVGLRPTRQRMALGWLLFGKGGRHLTAEMLYEEACQAKVPVSLATVYNTLNQLMELGLVRQINDVEVREIGLHARDKIGTVELQVDDDAAGTGHGDVPDY